MSKTGEPLEVLNQVVDFEQFREPLERALGYADGLKGGRLPYDPVVMFKVLILAARHTVTLMAGLGDIADADNLPASGYTYQWIRGGSELLGATGSSLTLSSNVDYGQKLRVRVSFTDGAGFLESRTSDETLPVTPRGSGAPR